MIFNQLDNICSANPKTLSRQELQAGLKVATEKGFFDGTRGGTNQELRESFQEVKANIEDWKCTTILTRWEAEALVIANSSLEEILKF